VAALVNAQMANLLDLDDNFLYSSHFASTSVLPALALAEADGRSGSELIAAVVGAFETTARVNLSMPGVLRAVSPPPSPRFRFPDPTGHSYNVFGAAAGAGRMLHLDATRMARAFGIAGYTAPVPTINKAFGSPHMPEMKYAAYGWMAWDGV